LCRSPASQAVTPHAKKDEFCVGRTIFVASFEKKQVLPSFPFMFDFLSKLFDTSGFPPRWFCGQWSEAHGWLHIGSDLLIFGAYAAIPISITAYVVSKKQEVEFQKLYYLFAAFILSCGFTHLVEATIFWHPWYRFSAAVKVMTAILSWATVGALIKILPVAFQLPGTVKLNQQLRQEVKERQESEAALQESSTRLELAMDHSGVGDWSWEEDSQLCELSKRSAEILGLARPGAYTWEQIAGLIAEEHREHVVESFGRAVESGAVVDEEFLISKNGAQAWISAKGRRIQSASGKLGRMVGTLADVTERKKADEERERLLEMESKARQEAEEANRMKDEFLAVLSHELRAPLNAILGWSNLLKDSEKKEDLDTGLEVIERNTLAQAKLVEDLLDMSRVTSGKIRLDLQTVDLRTIIKTAEDTILPSATAKKIRVICVVDPLAGPVRGDPSRLQQVLWNLLSNAVKFTPEGGRIEVAVERVNSHVEISISDTGMGITSDFLPHVFDRFRQADSTITRRYGGLGLGLALVKTLIEMHGGSIIAKSAGAGQGATFRISLPLPVATLEVGVHRVHPASDHTTEEADSDKPNLTGAKMLIVDDEADDGEMLRRLFAAQGAEVVVALTAAQGLAELDRHPFDVLISDIGMPGTDGFEFIKEVRATKTGDKRQIPAVALTAFARPDDRRRAMIAGFDTFLSKPVDTDELLAVVHRFVSRDR
jgi:PAS domain S-box-containing protein